MNTKLFAHPRSVLVSILLLASVLCHAQVVEFSDDFETGTANWVLTNLWGLAASNSNSPTNSLTESPTGNNGDSETAYATMANPVDLSAVVVSKGIYLLKVETGKEILTKRLIVL